MNSYSVVWAIDIDAESPEEAAQKALQYQRDPNSTATVFNVENVETGEQSTIDTAEA